MWWTASSQEVLVKIIFEDTPDSSDYILLARAGHTAAKEGMKFGDFKIYEYENGAIVFVYQNKNSIRVRM
jgi:hypothetical protein